MSVRQTTFYTCDFCYDKIESIKKGWFIVTINSEREKHACHDCGCIISNSLKRLNILVEFYCTEYRDTVEFGSIKVTLDNGVKVGLIFVTKREQLSSVSEVWL